MARWSSGWRREQIRRPGGIRSRSGGAQGDGGASKFGEYELWCQAELRATTAQANLARAELGGALEHGSRGGGGEQRRGRGGSD